MTLWFALPLMTAAAIFAVLWPLARAGGPARPARRAGRGASREKSKRWPRLGGGRPGLYAVRPFRGCREGAAQLAAPQWRERRARGRSRRVADGGGERRGHGRGEG